MEEGGREGKKVRCEVTIVFFLQTTEDEKPPLFNDYDAVWKTVYCSKSLIYHTINHLSPVTHVITFIL